MQVMANTGRNITDFRKNVTKVPKNTLDIQLKVALKKVRATIDKDLSNYTYHSVLKSRYNSSHPILTIERGGTPVRSLIVSSWRSGSTFTAQYINAHPASYYFAEPLQPYEGKLKFREESQAARLIEELFQCNHSNKGMYKNTIVGSILQKYKKKIHPHIHGYQLRNNNSIQVV